MAALLAVVVVLFLVIGLVTGEMDLAALGVLGVSTFVIVVFYLYKATQEKD